MGTPLQPHSADQLPLIKEVVAQWASSFLTQRPQRAQILKLMNVQVRPHLSILDAPTLNL